MGAARRNGFNGPWGVALVALAAALWLGCAEEPATAPGPSEPAPPEYTESQPPPFLAGPGDSGVAEPPPDAWYVVARDSVAAGTDRRVAGSRYEVHLLPGSLSQTTEIAIQEWNPDVIDFQLTPHGIRFLLPVVVTVDYTGTNADPLSPNYDGSLPIFIWLDPGSGIWEIVAGVNYPLTRKYVVTLTHFSRYACSGTAEW